VTADSYKATKRLEGCNSDTLQMAIALLCKIKSLKEQHDAQQAAAEAKSSAMIAYFRSFTPHHMLANENYHKVLWTLAEDDEAGHFKAWADCMTFQVGSTATSVARMAAPMSPTPPMAAAPFTPRPAVGPTGWSPGKPGVGRGGLGNSVHAPGPSKRH
jgi:hypothetical protein